MFDSLIDIKSYCDQVFSTQNKYEVIASQIGPTSTLGNLAYTLKLDVLSKTFSEIGELIVLLEASGFQYQKRFSNISSNCELIISDRRLQLFSMGEVVKFQLDLLAPKQSFKVIGCKWVNSTYEYTIQNVGEETTIATVAEESLTKT